MAPQDIVDNAHEIVDAYIRSGKRRDPDMKLISWDHREQDNYPIVYVESSMKVKVIDRILEPRIYTLITAWDGRQLTVECSSEVPNKFPESAKFVDEAIKRILRSVQFIRT